MAPRSLLGAVLGGEDDEGAAWRRDHVRPALRPRALLEQDELATFEVDTGLGQDGDDLEREVDVPVEVPVERVPVTGAVAEDQRRRSLLARRMAACEQLGVVGGKLSSAPPSRADQSFAIGARYA